MEILKPPMGMNFVSNNENWRRFERQFRCYYAACEIATKSGPTQVGILLHTAGPEAQDVHETFTYTGDEQRNDIETVLLKFRTYCEPVGATEEHCLRAIPILGSQSECE